ncbi:MAG: adenosine kinase [Saprospiraceae bacterium]|nr:adenosine kinase [Saprospiraceae bacterium]MCB9326083.1 adenosine kinase [Lewinellaceae bacterium]
MDKKYDIYGIGNALVDMEFEVTSDFFETHGIEKGLMTLVEEDRQNELILALRKHVTKKQSGGSAANTLIGASQFGSKCFYSCKVAKDEMGDFYMHDLEKANVKTNLNGMPRAEGLTGKCLVMITPDADRTMNTFLGITSQFSETELDEEALKDSKYLYIEGYLITSEGGRRAMKRAKKVAEKYGVKTALTFSDPNMVKFFKDQMDEVIGASVDLLFCNEDEAMTYTGTNDINVACEELKKVAKRFAITQGKNGALIFDGDTFIDIKPYPVKAIDTNGAGDMFAGAYLYAITHGHSHAEAGKIASLASSRVVSQFGPRLDNGAARKILEELYL